MAGVDDAGEGMRGWHGAEANTAGDGAGESKVIEVDEVSDDLRVRRGPTLEGDEVRERLERERGASESSGQGSDDGGYARVKFKSC